MRIALLGYGKMGQAIDAIATERGNEISFKVNIDNPEDINKISKDNTDVVIEFTQPGSAVDNINTILSKGVPIIVGTTGWLDHYDEVSSHCEKIGGTMLYASNYSLGVNIFFRLNEFLAKLMNGREYKAQMEEIHHTQKLDAPSGTAITLAEGMIAELSNKSAWVNKETNNDNEVGIVSIREPNVPGTHGIHYQSEVDTIEIKHTAHSRKGFALGAVLVAEWIKDKKGVLTMKDFLGF